MKASLPTLVFKVFGISAGPLLVSRSESFQGVGDFGCVFGLLRN
jgi:hypothetical protein